MSAVVCPQPVTYGPGENCGATVLPAYTPGLAETGFHLAWFLVVTLGVLLVGALLLWLQARLRPVQAEADVEALTFALASVSDQNAYLELMLKAAGVEYSQPGDRSQS